MIDRIEYTKPFVKATSCQYREDFHSKLTETLTKFPELEADVVTVGVTTSSVANAQILLSDQIKMGYNPSTKPFFFVMGHELTHFVQRLGNIPHGERACDVWTIARDDIFLDWCPHYLTIKRCIRDNWNIFAMGARELCIEAIAQRENGRRQYITWLEKEITKLASTETGDKQP